jgi:ligand-binding SRPBCC domain-containing protein
MTVRFECRSRIDAPIERVFDLALSIDAHLGSMARYGERAIGGVTSGQIGRGEEVTWRARHLGMRWTMTSRIVELERPTFFVDEQARGPFARFRHEHRFSSADGGTQMLDAVAFAAPYGPVGLLGERLLRPYVRSLILRRNAHLKATAESRTHGEGSGQ